MTKFILHGGGEMQRNEQHDEFFREIIGNVPDGGKILIVYFAISKEEADAKHHVYEEYFQDLSGDKIFELRVATEENFIEEIKWADAIYFRGGDTFKLIEAVKKHPDFKKELLKKGVVAGSSAGVYFLSNCAYSSSRDLSYEGLGILPIKANCHWSKEKKGVEKALEECPGELILLEEGEFKIIEQ